MSPSESTPREFDSAWLLLQVDRLCDRFEQSWQKGEGPSIESYLVEFAQTWEQSSVGRAPDSSAQRAPDLQHNRLLHALIENLIGVDVEYRRQLGEVIDWESYARRFRNFSAAVKDARQQRGGDETEIDSSDPLPSPPPTSVEESGSIAEIVPTAQPAQEATHRRRSVTRRRLVWGGLGILVASIATASFWKPSAPPVPRVHSVVIESIPAGARLSWTPVGNAPPDHSPIPRQSIAGEPLELAPGFYRVGAEVAGENFEVFRTVPAPGEPPVLTLHDVPQPHRSFQWEGSVVHLPAIRIVPTDSLPGDWTELPGGTVTIPDATTLDRSWRGKSQDVSRFYIDRHEITGNELRTVFPQLTLAVHEHVLDGGIPFDIAVAYAEQVGKQLPTIWEMIWAATNRGTTKFSWGDEAPSLSLAAVAANPPLFRDVTPGVGAIYDLQLGRVEWTATLRGANRSTARGEPATAQASLVYGLLGEIGRNQRSAATWAPAADSGEFISITQQPAHAGFRCVRRLGR